MNLVIGVVLSAAAVFLFSWGFAQHRRAVPARWTQYGWLSSGFVMVVITLVPGALGALTMAVSDAAGTLATLRPWGIVAMAVALVLVIWGTPRFIREGRTGAADVVPFPVRPGGSPAAPRKVKRAA